jgi:hypothetical protein
LEVIEKDGLNGVTHSKVARRSGVSRAWIYEYIGKEKGALIEFAADVFAGYFAKSNLPLPQSKSELELRLKEGIGFLFDTAEMNPIAIKLYYRLRGTANPIGTVIRKHEKQWLEGAAKTLVNVLGTAPDQASLVAELGLTLRLGYAHRFATSAKPGEARQRAEQTFGFIHALLGGL